MLNLHFLKQSHDFRHKLKVIFEQLAFKHSCKVFRNFLAFLETALQIIGNLGYVGHVVIFWVFIVFFGEFELHFVRQEELYCEVHDFLIFL